MDYVPERINADRLGPPPLVKKQTQTVTSENGKPSFSDHLKLAMDDLKPAVNFSAHAKQRMEKRNIQLDNTQTRRLANAIDSASKKDAGTALVLLDDLAILVGVKDRKVITLVDRNDMQDNVFTAIDSAVIA